MCRIHTAFAAVASLVVVSSARGDEPTPPIGTVRTLSVLTLSLDVGSTEQDTKRAVYAPPPGWYVRSHRVVTASKKGSVTYTVSTVPAGWDWKTDRQTTADLKASGTAKVTAYKVSGGGQGEVTHNVAAKEKQSAAASHHALMVEANAKGAGLWMGGSGIELTVVAELVYIGK